MKHLIVTMLSAVFFIAAMPTSAQQNASYPNQRPQWTEAQGEAWQQKYGPIIGVNCPYPPCSAISQEEAIALAAHLGYNSVRWWPGGGTDTEAYIKSVEQWAAWAQKYGMTVSPVFPFPQTYFARGDREKALGEMEAQVRQVIRHFRGDDRIILWDVWNEPALGDSTEVELQMTWIEHIVAWARQEGCTQPLTASIIWDAGVPCNTTSTPIRTRRERTEALMDLHNYHSYMAQDGFNQDTPTMVSRIRKMDNRPIVCTECMTRTNGSTFARTLYDFERYHINFYSWGLFACDPNWEVRWERSTFYNWEPMFHNLLYADGEPVDERDLPLIRNFRFRETNEDPGAEWTERWTLRRAWRRMSGRADAPRRLTLSYQEYAADAEAFHARLEQQLAAAEASGNVVVPVLLSGWPDGATADQLGLYTYSVIDRHHADRRILGWCIYEQAGRTDGHALPNLLQTLFHRARYAFPNQPMFAAPAADGKADPDSSGTDLHNLMWRLSDICAVSGKASRKTTQRLNKAYNRPVISIGSTSATLDLTHPSARHNGARWPAWRAWQSLCGSETRGLTFGSVSQALEALEKDPTFNSPPFEKDPTPNPSPSKGGELKVESTKPSSTILGLYNSLCVPFSLQAWEADRKTFYRQADRLLALAERMNISLLPRLLDDSCLVRPTSRLQDYVQDVVNHYADRRSIIAWDLYHRICHTSTDTARATEVLDALFKAAWHTRACQPLFATPTVFTREFPQGFDPIGALTHGRYAGGWARLAYGNADEKLCYKAWSLSDVIAYTSGQPAEQLGWLNSTANKFGRPLFCTEWEPDSDETDQKTIDIFQDMHVRWYARKQPSPQLVRQFHHIPVSTGH